MLAACCEAEPGEDALVALGRDSQARWPAFAAELLKASGIDVELRTEGTLVVALTADDQARIHHHLAHQKKLGLPLEWISAAETRRREPHLAGKLAGALWSPEDHQVDNRKLAAGLRIAAEAAGATIHEHKPVKEISIASGRADGVVLADGVKVAADVVVLAAGAWSRGDCGRRARAASAGAPDQGPDAVAQDGSGGAADQPRDLGARRLHGSAPRRPPDHRRHGRGEGVRHRRSPPADC